MIYNGLKKCIFEGEIKNTKPEFESLRIRIDELIEGYGDQPYIVFESTGVYSRQLERFMQDNDYSYCFLNPLEAKKQCDSLRIHKTDKSDAHQLALTHFTVSRRETNGADNLFHQLKSLSRYYSELDDELSVIRNRMHKVIQLTFPELEKLFTTKSELFLNMVQLFPHPDFVKGLSKTIIKNKIRSNTNKNTSTAIAKKKAIALIEAAQQCYPAVSSSDVLCEQLRSYAKRYQDLL